MKKLLGNIFIIGILAFTIYYGATHNDKVSLKYEGNFENYYVCEGETLWSIAEDLCDDKDTRDVIYAIKYDNNLQSASVYEGQLLKIRNQY